MVGWSLVGLSRTKDSPSLFGKAIKKFSVFSHRWLCCVTTAGFKVAKAYVFVHVAAIDTGDPDAARYVD